MKKTLILLTAVVSLLMATSCSKDDVDVATITIPAGKTSVFRQGLDFDNNAGEKTVNFSANKPWTASVDETRNGEVWCSVSPQSGDAGDVTLTIKVSDNASYDDRGAVVRFSYGGAIRNIVVNQKQTDALTLTTKKFEMDSVGGTIEIEAMSNVDYEYQIAEDCESWIHPTTSNVQSRAIQSSKISFDVDANLGDKREGTIVIRNGVLTDTVKVYQLGGAEGVLTLTQNVYNLSGAEQDVSIEINSNFRYSVEMPKVDWITENRGMSTHTLNLHISENEPDSSKRTAFIRIYDKNSSLSDTVTINQSPLNAILLDQKTYEFDDNGGDFAVGLGSNVNYKILIADNWISEKENVKTRALKRDSLNFSVAKMEFGEERTSKITFTDSEGTTDEITVIQKAPLYLKKSQLALFANDSVQLTFVNKTGQNVIWSSSDKDVVSVDAQGNIKAINKGEATITVSTADKSHSNSCNVVVSDITDYVSAQFSKGSITSSKLCWTFANTANESVKLISTQLVDGQTSQKGHETSVNATVGANKSIQVSTTVGLAGIHAPVTCIFKYEFHGKEHKTQATYDPDSK